MRKTVQILIGLIISLLALWLAFRGANLAQVAEALREANYFVLLPAAFLVWLGLVFRAQSWRVILFYQVPYKRVYNALNEGYLLNNLLPFRLGEFGRAYLITRGSRLTTAQALSSVVVERVIDLLVILMLVLAYLPQLAGIGLSNAFALTAGLIGLGALVGLVAVARYQGLVLRLARMVLARLPWFDTERWAGRVAALLEGLSVLRDPRRAFLAAFWSGLAWVASGFSAWVLLSGFVPNASLSMGFFALLAVGLGNAIPSLPGAMGVFEAATVLALGVFGVPESLALSFALVFHLLHLALTSALGGLALAGEGETIAHLARSAQALLGGTDGRARDAAAPVSSAPRPADVPTDQ